MSEIDPRLERAFEALRSESRPAPRPEAMAAARAAMHQARALEPERGLLPRLARRLGTALTVHRLMAAGTGLAAGAAAVALLGWNAPAGSPLHGVRVAHEQLALVLPGSDRAGLDLGYAESRLEQARHDGSAAALDEAQRLLDDAHAHLSAGSALWPRWERDEKLLGELRHHDGDSGSGTEGAGGDGGSGAESTSTSGDGGEHEGGSSTQSASSTSDGEGGSTSGGDSQSTTTTTTTTSRESSSTSTSSGGGGDGGGSSSTSSSSTSDGGGGGGGGGGGDSAGGGGSTSSSTTSGGRDG